MEKEQIIIDLGSFTPCELERIEKAAAAKKMTLSEYIVFLLKV